MFSAKNYDFSNFPSDYDVQIYEDCRRWVEKQSGGVVAVFDIGTRAARLLVAPSRVPASFEQDTFWSKGYIFNLGQTVGINSGSLDLASRNFRTLLEFVSSHAENLKSVGVEDISAIGTAVFRWLRNRDDVRATFFDRTRLELTILEQQEEARLMLATLPDVLARRGVEHAFGANDRIMLIDQGGGSLEVSWMSWDQRFDQNPLIHKKLFEELGTEALKRCMYSMDSNFESIDPHSNLSSVRDQLRLAKLLARLPVEAWYSSPISDADNKIHAFAVGSAISSLVSASSFERHGTFVSVEEIDLAIDDLTEELSASPAQMCDIYKYVEGGSAEGPSELGSPLELDKKLASICGLPAIWNLLSKINIPGVTLSGYGLRYAYYIWRQLHARIEPDLNGHSAFISYSKSDIGSLIPEFRLLRSAGVRFWYDQGIAPAKDWVKTIASSIEDSEVVICFLTASSSESEWVRRELTFANSIRKPIIFVRVDDSPVPPDLLLEFGRYQFVERFMLNDQAYKDQLLQGFPPGSLPG